MIKVKGFSAFTPMVLGKEISKWLEENPNFSSIDIQYRIFSMESESNNHCALVIYEDGEV